MAYRGDMSRPIRRLVSAGAVALVAALVFAGPVSAEDRWITMYDNSYRPSSVRILPGEKVTFVNDDDVPHDAVGNGWSVGMLGYYDSEAETFARAGTYRFSCSIHPEMRGTVYVGVSGGGAGVTDPPTDTLAPAATADSSAGGPGGLALLLGAWAATVVGLTTVIGRRSPRRD